MTELNRAGQVNSLGHIDTIQKVFRDQIDVVSDELRQLAGNAEVPEEALNAPYLIYVNPYTGKDTYVSGDYKDTGDPAQRISLQRLECGYTEAAPFRTLSRACLEAAIITSRDYQDAASKQNALVSIVVMTGNHIIFNDKGELDSTANFPAWEDGKVPTDAELAAFNPRTRGGVILPRGASLISLDLRKTILRPNYVPTPGPEEADLSNRTALLRVTGQCYLYGFTLRDKEGANYSHHLISGFEYANQAELDEFYSKVLKTFGGLSAGNAVPDTGENTIVGPAPRNPVEPVDTTGSASPYVYNTSLRSEWGFCGMFASGDQAAGFKSMVVAQYTGVSLQRDLRAWQKYVAGNWVTFTDYDDLISTDPDDVRPTPEWRSFHVRTSNGAVIQEVSVFAIGQAIHHLAESGSQITITNSNSNFGGCAALADGFQLEAAPGDTPWSIELVRRAVDPFEKTSNIKRIFLGQLEETQANSATTLDLTTDLTASTSDPTQPDLLVREDYSLKENDYVWVENPGGPDYRAQLAATPWTSSAADKIQIKTAVRTDNDSGNYNPDDANADDNAFNDIEGKRVYVRRLRDVRSVEERRYSIIVSGGTNKVRLPVRDYVIQPTLGGDWSTQLQAVAGSERTEEVTNGANVELRYSKRPDADTDFDPAVYYRKADVVRKDNKHWFSVATNYGPWNADNWSETYVHMEEEYAPEGYYTNAQPIITFDKDSDQDEDSSTLGNTLSDNIVQAQLRSAVDYQGVFYLLLNLGYTKAQAYTFLDPQASGATDSDVSGNNWNVEYRRPTNIRLYSHAYEWAGYNNYSKALPQYQGELSPNNKFTFYFTNQDGGKVYASGFNEEGLTVTPRGLEDLTTGKVLGLEEIGNPDRDISFPTVFEDLKVTNTLDVEGAEIIGLQTALTTRVGGGEIASIADIRGATIRTTDAGLNEAGARFITPEGLEYWRDYRALVSEQTGSKTYYVVPDHASEGDTIVYNGDSVLLTSNPARSAAASLDNDLPNTPSRGVYFRTAVELANSELASTQTANYVLGNGRYWNTIQAFEHTANVFGATRSFPQSNECSTDYATGGKTTTDIMSLYRNYDLPCFGGGIASATSVFYGVASLTHNPVTLHFKYGGEINGVAYIGLEELIADSTNWPDTLFAGLGAYRTSSGNILANYANAWYPVQGQSKSFYSYSTRYRIHATNTGLVRITNLISGAATPGSSSLVRMEDAGCSLSGIYFLGSINVRKSDYVGIPSMNTNEVTGCQHLRSLVQGSGNLEIYFDLVYGTRPTPNSNVYNYDINCLHILDKNGNYGTKASASGSNRGATFRSILGGFGNNTNLKTGSFRSYRTQGTPGGGAHGWLGTLGNSISVNDTEYSAASINFNLGINTTRGGAYVDRIFQQAITGAALNSPLPTVAANAFNADSNSDNKPGGWYWGTAVPVVNISTNELLSGIADNWLNCNNVQALRGGNLESGTSNEKSIDF